MANAWGTSWGGSWASAWGGVDVVVPPVEPPLPPIPDVVKVNYTGRYLVTQNKMHPALPGTVFRKTRMNM